MGPAGRWRLDVPAPFAAGVVAHGGGAGQRWLDDLPGLVDALLERWDLVPDGPTRHGFLGLVLPVRQQGTPLAVKVGRPSAEVDNQVAALEAWRGRGMVALHAADPERGALLLERLDPDRTLASADPAQAYPVAAGLLRRLAVPAGDAELPHLAGHVADWPDRWERESSALGRPLPEPVLTAAARACRERAATIADRVLVDHDLHLDNVLPARREAWLAVDPRGVVGDAAFMVAPMLWNHFRGLAECRERFATFVDVAGLDRAATSDWTLVRVVDHFLWSTAAGLTWDPAACGEIATWLAPT